MREHLTRRAVLVGATATLALPGHAATRSYELVAERSTISFHFVANGLRQTGRVPIGTADIRVDPGNLAASSADVTADIRKATTGLLFVTQTLKSKSVLDAKNHPIVRFSSTRIQLGEKGRISEGARIQGELTLRGVTREIAFDATLSRPAGTSPDDLSVLYIKLNGVISRSAFGASGFADLVDDSVEIDIRAEIRTLR